MAGSISVLSFRTRHIMHTWQLPLPASPDMGNVSADGSTLWLSGRYNSEVYAINTAHRQAAGQDPGRRRPARAVRVASARALLTRSHRNHALRRARARTADAARAQSASGRGGESLRSESSRCGYAGCGAPSAAGRPAPRLIRRPGHRLEPTLIATLRGLRLLRLGDGDLEHAVDELRGHRLGVHALGQAQGAAERSGAALDAAIAASRLLVARWTASRRWSARRSRTRCRRPARAGPAGRRGPGSPRRARSRQSAG